MPEPKWTKGPWEHLGSLVYANRPKDGGTICQVSEVRHSHIVQHKEPDIGSPDGEEIYANARLIAAAPNLYRACEGLKEALDRAMDYIGNGYQPQDIVAEAREARDQADLFMAQARGGTDV